MWTQMSMNLFGIGHYGIVLTSLISVLSQLIKRLLHEFIVTNVTDSKFLKVTDCSDRRCFQSSNRSKLFFIQTFLMSKVVGTLSIN